MATAGRVIDARDDLAAARSFDRAVDLLHGRTIAFLTGAGISTDSGIPDYRGPNSVARTPMTFREFESAAKNRQRYWTGSQLGWRRFGTAEPNPGHRAIADLERAGLSNGVITQNVDELHVRAGSRRVVDVHGSMSKVVCLTCRQSFARRAIADRISAANPWIDGLSAELRPDGDAEVQRHDQFIVPECGICGGILKPDVVFFGELIPTEKFTLARSLIRSADALVIAGSSLVVNSGIRLLDQASKQGLPVVIINRGATKGDARADLKIDAGTSQTLTTLAERLSR